MEETLKELERQVQCAESSDAVIAAASQKNRFFGWLHRWRGQSKEKALKSLLSALYPKLQQAVTETTAWLEQRARHKEAQLQDAQSKQRLLDEAIEAEQRALDCFDDLVNDCLSLSYDMTKSMRDLRAVMDFNEEVLSNASRSRSSSRAHAAAPASAPAPVPPPTSPHSPSSASSRKKATLALLPLQAQTDDEARPAEPAVWHGYKGAENFQINPKRTIHYSKSPATTSLVSVLTAGGAQAANASSTISDPHLPTSPAANANANAAPNAISDGLRGCLSADSPSNITAIATNTTHTTHTTHSTSSRPRSLSSSSHTLAHHPSQLSLSTHGKSPLDALQHYHYTDADHHESRGKFAACYEVSCQALAMVDALRRQRQAEAVALSSAKKQRAALCTLCQGDSLDDGLDDDGLGGLGCITLEGLSIANGLLRAVCSKEGRGRDRDNRDSTNSSNNGKDGKDGMLLRKSSSMYSVLNRFSAGGAVKAMASSCSNLHSTLVRHD